MYGDEKDLLAAEEQYWDEVDEQDDGIPRRYGTQKDVVYIREGEVE